MHTPHRCQLIKLKELKQTRKVCYTASLYSAVITTLGRQDVIQHLNIWNTGTISAHILGTDYSI